MTRNTAEKHTILQAAAVSRIVLITADVVRIAWATRCVQHILRSMLLDQKVANFTVPLMRWAPSLTGEIKRSTAILWLRRSLAERSIASASKEGET